MENEENSNSEPTAAKAVETLRAWTAASLSPLTAANYDRWRAERAAARDQDEEGCNDSKC
jgi:hypothetical protein